MGTFAQVGLGYSTLTFLPLPTPENFYSESIVYLLPTLLLPFHFFLLPSRLFRRRLASPTVNAGGSLRRRHGYCRPRPILAQPPSSTARPVAPPPPISPTPRHLHRRPCLPPPTFLLILAMEIAGAQTLILNPNLAGGGEEVHRRSRFRSKIWTHKIRSVEGGRSARIPFSFPVNKILQACPVTCV